MTTKEQFTEAVANVVQAAEVPPDSDTAILLGTIRPFDPTLATLIETYVSAAKAIREHVSANVEVNGTAVFSRINARRAAAEGKTGSPVVKTG